MLRILTGFISVSLLLTGSAYSQTPATAALWPAPPGGLPSFNGDAAMDAYIANFYVDDGNGAGHYSSQPANTVMGPSVNPAPTPAPANGCNMSTTNYTGNAPAAFWNQAEEIEATEDAARRNPLYLPIVVSLLDGFVQINTRTWTNVTCYNDDIMWATLAFTRGYELTGRQSYLALAQSNFDAAYARGYDPTIMAMRWNVYIPVLNAITNETASLAAALLAKDLPAPNSYAAKSLTLFNYVLANYYQPDGAVIGATGQGPTTYNEGVFIQAAFLNGHLTEAANTANYLSTVAGQVEPGSGIYHILTNYAGDQNNLGFNSIALRWLYRYAVDSNTLNDYEPWIQANALASYNERNEAGNSWQDWLAMTPPNSLLLSWDCVSGVTVAQVSDKTWW